MNAHQPIGILLTFEDVKKKVDEYHDLEKVVAEARARLEETGRWINAVYELLPPDKRPDFLTKVAPSLSPAFKQESAEIDSNSNEKPGVMNAYLMVIARHPEGLSYPELRAQLFKTEAANGLRNNPNTLYTNVGRLIERKKAIKRGSKIFTPEYYDACLAKYGADWVGFDDASTSIHMQRLVQGLLEERPLGMDTAEILSAMRQEPALNEHLDGNKQYGYTILAKMARKGRITKRGNRYFVKKYEGEAEASKENGGEQMFDRQN
jgi:hypothetical protein